MKEEHRVILYSFISGCTLWVLNGILDSLLFRSGSIADALLFRVPAHALYSRSLCILGFLLFGGLVSYYLSKKKRAELERDKAASFLEMIFDSIHDPFIILNSRYEIVRANTAYARMKGIPSVDLPGRKCHEVTKGRDSVCEDCIVQKTFQSADPCAKEKLQKFSDGSECWMEIYTYPIPDEKQENVSYVIEYVQDITARKKAEEEKKRIIEELEILSTTDSLTGLLNRRQLIEKLGLEIDRARRYGSQLSIILCDLDNFKEINDNYGHNSGDEVLKKVAELLRNSARVSDIVGRYGGDEFLVILPETSIKGAEEMAERIRRKVERIRGRNIYGDEVRTTISLGITNLSGHEKGIDGLINDIDIALYNSKRSGKNRFCSVTV